MPKVPRLPLPSDSAALWTSEVEGLANGLMPQSIGHGAPPALYVMIPWLLGTNDGSTVPASSFHLHKGLAKSFIDWKYVLAG